MTVSLKQTNRNIIHC